MKILGIETSCDETAAAVIHGHKNGVAVLSNIISSQIEIHKKYGGVVPEVAAREHVLAILPVINEALSKAELKPSGIDAIAVTVGPGLITSLIVGVETAKTLAYAWNIPVVAINHIEGHIYANFIREVKSQKSKVKTDIKFPVLILTVSGGHTMLVLMKGHGKYQIIGDTLDDAAGEAFDKAAQILELGYPGGPAIANCASQSANHQLSDSRSMIHDIRLPRPMLNKKNFDFSFSGLKTALLYQVKKDTGWKKRKAEYAAEFQQAVIDVLVAKTIKAATHYKAKIVMLSGGVAANTELRQQMTKAVGALDLPFRIPELSYCTDNAAMIAAAGYYRAWQKKYTPWQKLKTDANLKL